MAMDNNTMLAVLAVVILVAIAAWFLMRKRDSEELERRFGPEYGRAVDEMGSRPKAEAELRARQKRVEKLSIVPLSPADADRFTRADARVEYVPKLRALVARIPNVAL